MPFETKLLKRASILEIVLIVASTVPGSIDFNKAVAGSEGVVGAVVEAVVEAGVVVTVKLLKLVKIMAISLNMSPLLSASFDSAFKAVVGAAVVVEAVVRRTATGLHAESQCPV